MLGINKWLLSKGLLSTSSANGRKYKLRLYLYPVYPHLKEHFIKSLGKEKEEQEKCFKVGIVLFMFVFVFLPCFSASLRLSFLIYYFSSFF